MSTSIYADGDVLFNPFEVKNAVSSRGGVSKLHDIFVIDYDEDTWGADLFLTQASGTLGTINATANISDADFSAMKLCSVYRHIQSTGKSQDLDNININKCMTLADSAEGVNATLLQAEPNSTSIYISGVLNTGSPTFAAEDNIEIILNIEYL